MSTPSDASAGVLVVSADDPRSPDVVALLEAHLALMRSLSPPEDVHALDLDASTQLGLSIVRTLVESELGGVLEIGPGSRGTRVQADLPVE